MTPVTAIRITLTCLVMWPMASSPAVAQGVPGGAAPAITRTVDVDGIAIRVRTVGLEMRRPGGPVIVFEGGASAPLETWDSVLPAVARFAPVLAYDRAGTGASTWDGLPPTPERVSSRLRRLLSRLEVSPPYVMVGHSWGGALVRYFAGWHPREVVGVLYIDPTDIALTRNDLVALFESIGAGAAEYDAFDRIMKQSIASLPAALVAEGTVISDLIAIDLERRGLPPQPDVPASVIVAGRVAAPPQALLPFDTKAYAKAMHENQARRLRTWVRTGGTFEVAIDSGHSVHVDDPERVVAAIRRLVARVSP
jgi:pimeloyl-ACP methyl ester carboxylesterase